MDIKPGQGEAGALFTPNTYLAVQPLAPVAKRPQESADGMTNVADDVRILSLSATAQGSQRLPKSAGGLEALSSVSIRGNKSRPGSAGRSNSSEDGAMTSKTTNKLSPEVQTRAVRMVLDHASEHSRARRQ